MSYKNIRFLGFDIDFHEDQIDIEIGPLALVVIAVVVLVVIVVLVWM